LANLIHNEKAKLHATFLNNLAVAALVGGLIAPMYNSSALSYLSNAGAIVAGGIVAAVFHAGALWCLSGLKE
jgi:hypothetical protein